MEIWVIFLRNMGVNNFKFLLLALCHAFHCELLIDDIQQVSNVSCNVSWDGFKLTIFCMQNNWSF